MPDDRVRAAAENIVIRVARRGRQICRSEAAARAMVYLEKRGLRVPTTLGQAMALDLRERHELRVLCEAWRQWAEGKDLDRCMQAIDLLASIKPGVRGAMRPTMRYVPGPICGWSPMGPRGVLTTGDWRRKAAA
jgi:hypothetical protein